MMEGETGSAWGARTEYEDKARKEWEIWADEACDAIGQFIIIAWSRRRIFGTAGATSPMSHLALHLMIRK